VKRVLLLLVLLVGCRAQVGVGLGLGADVQVPGLVHTGFLVGMFAEAGPTYDRSDGRLTLYATLGLVHFHSGGTFMGGGAQEHVCLGLLPALAALRARNDFEVEACWPLEVGLALLFVELRWGLNPAAIDHGGRSGPPPDPAPYRPPGEAPPAPGEERPLAPTARSVRLSGDDDRYVVDLGAPRVDARVTLRVRMLAARSLTVSAFDDDGEQVAQLESAHGEELRETFTVGGRALHLVVRGPKDAVFDLEASRP
jgi:hypothetical protein